MIGGIIIYNIRYKRKINFEKDKLCAEVITKTTVSDIQEMMSMFVDECFNDFLFFHPDYVNTKYINEADEKKIMDEVTNILSARLSESFVRKISFYYNAQIISSIFADKIYIKVTDYVVSVNQPKS